LPREVCNFFYSLTNSFIDQNSLTTDIDTILLRVKEMLLGILKNTSGKESSAAGALPKDPANLLKRIENLGHKKEFNNEDIYDQLIANKFVSLEQKSEEDAEHELHSVIDRQK
jgi:hypothetical protein